MSSPKDTAADPTVGRPRRVALAVCIAAAKVLLASAVLPAAEGCSGTIYPIEGLFQPELAWLLLPHLFGLLAAVTASLFLTGWARRFRGLEMAVLLWAHVSWLALGFFFFFAIEGNGGAVLSIGCLIFPVLLLARASSTRWRAVRALWVGALECFTWYLFWIFLAQSDGAAEVILWGTYVAAVAAVVLFVAGRRLEREVARYRAHPAAELPSAQARTIKG